MLFQLLSELLLLASQFLFPIVAPDGPTVSLEYGTFLGATDGNLTKFLGIPFARPTGRFELPRPPVQLHGLQNATAFGPVCPQQALSPLPVFPIGNPYTSVSEACLLLDVYMPSTAQPSSKLPVLFWIYGGGFEAGHTSLTDMRQTVERSIFLGEPMIVVAPNYRLNAFGFLAGKEVSDAGLTNLGLRDQLFALQWAKKHVSSFGGDPERIVVGGQSAGSISTALLLLSNKQNSGSLFRGAFMVSGSPGSAPHSRRRLVMSRARLEALKPAKPGPFRPGQARPDDITTDGQPYYDQLVIANNCTAASDTLDCLKRVPFDDFMATVNRTADFLSYRSLSLVWRPRVDGDVLVRNPPLSVAQGEFAKVKSIYLPGGTSAEVAQIAALYPEDPVVGSPFGTGNANALTPEFKRVAAFEGDIFFQGPRRLFLEHASKTQNTWSWLSKRGKSTPYVGATHSSDKPMFFPANISAMPDTVAIDSLINFLNTLDPNVSAAPKALRSRSNTTGVFWPKWQTASSEGSTSLLTFSDPALVNVTADDFRADGIDFLNSLHLEGVTAIGL
ncbi:Carboxylic ester hydrolase [Mycena sanguinolenta]|uniref:Carboxylic ester hydrolase n=1 Tax=Mycena sanguinolenta TaxID=230812 RepID=A0A8H6ZAZ8_9AGAR|nr:Carboxylic ester hydrolase [Mycena sanguinolenta]